MPDDGSLLPDVSRFKKPSVIDDAGKNRFSEEESEPSAPVAEVDYSSNPFFASAQQSATPAYQPRYEVTQKHRGTLLLVLSTVALAGVSGGLAGLLTMYPYLFTLFIFSFPLNLITSFIAFQDLRAIRFGAMDPAGKTSTKVAFYLTTATNMIYLSFLVIILVMAKVGYDLLEQWFG